jgi:hypothetical protein
MITLAFDRHRRILRRNSFADDCRCKKHDAMESVASASATMQERSTCFAAGSVSHPRSCALIRSYDRCARIAAKRPAEHGGGPIPDSGIVSPNVSADC